MQNIISLLKEDAPGNDSVDFVSFFTVGSSQLTDYNLINREKLVLRSSVMPCSCTFVATTIILLVYLHFFLQVDRIELNVTR